MRWNGLLLCLLCGTAAGRCSVWKEVWNASLRAGLHELVGSVHVATHVDPGEMAVDTTADCYRDSGSGILPNSGVISQLVLHAIRVRSPTGHILRAAGCVGCLGRSAKLGYLSSI